MAIKWKLTITQARKYSCCDSTYDESISVTHNRNDKLVALMDYLNDTFPEELGYVLESVEEEDEDDYVD